MSTRTWWLALNVAGAALVMLSFAGICAVLVATVAKIGGVSV